MRELQVLHDVWQSNQCVPAHVFLKFHPSVRFQFLFRMYLKIFYRRISEERRCIEKVLNEYTQLYTVNSTVVLDFLIAGKTVLLSDRSVLPNEIVECCTLLSCVGNHCDSSEQKSSSGLPRLAAIYFNIS